MWCFKDRLPPLNNPQKRTYCWVCDFVTPNGFLARPGHSTPVLLYWALLQSWAPQEPFPIPHLPSCEDETVNSSSSLGGWKRDICGALSNCTWHTVLRCTGEDGWQSKTLLRFFCLFPLSSMKIARDINAEEPKKTWNGKMEREASPAYTACSLQSRLICSGSRYYISCAAADAPVPWITTMIQKKASD